MERVSRFPDIFYIDYSVLIRIKFCRLALSVVVTDELKKD